MAEENGLIDSTTEARSPEQSLLDQLDRVAHDRAGRFVVQIYLSRLQPQNRQPYHIRIASRSFDSLLGQSDAQLFVLTSGDIMLMCHSVGIGEVDMVIEKVRALFRGDPLAREEGGAGFSSWYDLDNDYDELLVGIKTLVRSAQRRKAGAEDASAGRGQSAAMAGRPLDPVSLAKVNDILGRAQVADFIRRQSAVIIGADGTEKILFHEHFVSIGLLQRRLAPGYSLVSDLWLFQYLTETIDRRVLAHLGQVDVASLKDAISLNLNVSTVLGPDFRKFATGLGAGSEKVVVEIQMIDVFSDLAAFARARDWLGANGFRVLLDGLTPLSLSFFDPGLFAADLVKVAWGSGLAGHDSIEDDAERRELIDAIGKEKFILARTDSESAVKWALSLGIRRFQGRFVDLLIQRQAAKTARAGAPA